MKVLFVLVALFVCNSMAESIEDIEESNEFTTPLRRARLPKCESDTTINYPSRPSYIKPRIVKPGRNSQIYRPNTKVPISGGSALSPSSYNNAYIGSPGGYEPASPAYYPGRNRGTYVQYPQSPSATYGGYNSQIHPTNAYAFNQNGNGYGIPNYNYGGLNNQRMPSGKKQSNIGVLIMSLIRQKQGRQILRRMLDDEEEVEEEGEDLQEL